jgi:NTE family protein
MARRNGPLKTVNLALQGGGSHGAFTWGVLDRLLQEERLDVEGISGASAGAMNGAMVAQGFFRGGREGARRALERFWLRIGEIAGLNPLYRTLADRLLGVWGLDPRPGGGWFDAMSHAFSPYDLNPLNFNPLREVLEDLIEVDAIRSCAEVKLFVSATNVETGRVRIFSHEELTLDALLASACLPFAFHAVEIDGAPYWDGGYMGNPAIFPLIYNCESRDVAVVQINPLLRPGTPKTATDILNRVNEITFNAPFLAEMRAIAFVQRLIEQDQLKGEAVGRLKSMRMHLIGAEDRLRALGAASKMNADLGFLLELKALGRAAAELWLKQNWAALGKRSSVDLRKVFLT